MILATIFFILFNIVDLIEEKEIVVKLVNKLEAEENKYNNLNEIVKGITNGITKGLLIFVVLSFAIIGLNILYLGISFFTINIIAVKILIGLFVLFKIARKKKNFTFEVDNIKKDKVMSVVSICFYMFMLYIYTTI